MQQLCSKPSICDSGPVHTNDINININNVIKFFFYFLTTYNIPGAEAEPYICSALQPSQHDVIK